MHSTKTEFFCWHGLFIKMVESVWHKWYSIWHKGVKFLNIVLFQIEIDWEKIEAKIEMEFQKERERPERSTASTGGTGGGGAGTGTSGRSSVAHSRQSLKT